MKSIIAILAGSFLVGCGGSGTANATFKWIPSQWYVLGTTAGEIRRVKCSDPTGLTFTVIVPKDANDYAPSDYSEVTKKVAYVGVRAGFRQIFLTDINGSFRQQITTIGENDGPKFSPDGRKLIFAHSDTVINSNNSIKSYDIQTGITIDLQPSTENANIGLDYLPNGDGYIYGSFNGTSTIKWVHANGTPQIVGTSNHFGCLEVSPDSNTIAILSNDFGSYLVETIQISTGAKTAGPAYGLSGLSFIPDNSLVFNFGSIRRYIPSSGLVSNILAFDYGSPVLAKK